MAKSPLLPLLASLACLVAPSPASLEAAITPVGSGSYTTTFPGTDVAGRNGVPSGSPQLSGSAVGRPVPTNDWWSTLLKSDHAGNLFNYPLAMRTLPAGLSVGLIVPVSTPNGASQPLSDLNPVVVGVIGLAATRATVDGYSDWTVRIAWDSSGRAFRATSGIGMPFVYFAKGSSDTASVTVNAGTVTVMGDMLVITGSQGGANFAVYGPTGSTWTQSGTTYTSTLAGKDYWSMAILPSGNAAANAAAWKRHAHVEPTNTTVAWTYDEATARLRTDFTTTVQVHEGEGTTVIQGLLPHQWANLAADSPALAGISLGSIRGELKLLAANSFATEHVFRGILPTLPAVGVRSPGFSPTALHGKIAALQDETLATWTDSYNEGQVMNRLIQTARAAHETGDLVARDRMVATVRERLEDWLTAEAGEVAFLFHYQPTWSALIGYPAGHGQDTNLNDHHFHWGYFIHAAAFLEQFQPGWAAQWGPMVDLLVRDAASPRRDDPLFPFLRSFSPFAGHAWANGFATFPFGNDQESSSESMQFNSALIHWGAITGDKAVRDLGIYLYVTEQAAIGEYWFDRNDRTFKDGYGFSVASRIWGNGYDNQTFWTGDIAAAYGIELYPIHGGSFYLGHDIAYAQRLWTEMSQKTGILAQAANPNLWHDVYWQFLAFTDPAAAIALYDANPGRSLKFGVSDAQTYYWLHGMNALGRLDASVTADDPLAVVFTKGGSRTYVAHNYGSTPRRVTFSDGATLDVPPRSLATSLDLPFRGSITTPFAVAPAGNTVPLVVALEGDTSSLTAVELYSGDTWLATRYGAPWEFRTAALPAGNHVFHARLVAGERHALTGFVTVRVGDTLPYAGVPAAIPGVIEAGAYDRFEGGRGQGITYFDVSADNEGDFREEEAVDVSANATEGPVVGWISDGEWIDYTVDVAETGRYSLAFRYASGNTAGGGPFHVELDGRVASAAKTVPSTGGWSTSASATLADVELRAGRGTLRLRFTRGELNVGRLTFTRTGPLAVEPPVARAGADGVVVAPATTITLDGSASSVRAGATASYAWTQVSGPAVARLSGASTASPSVEGLDVDGLYRFRLVVDDGASQDADVVDVQRGELAARPPSVAIASPSTGARGLAGQPVVVNVAASDPDGQVVRVDLWNGDVFLGSLDAAPYRFEWYAPEGTHALRATALDSDGLSATSSAVAYVATPPLPCRQSSTSGNFAFEFGRDGTGHTITFIPSRTGVGSTLVLLYYGVGGGPYPGYRVYPNTPFRLNVTDGQSIGFYFTYSVPEGGERNSIAENATATIGSCGAPVVTDPAVALASWRAAHFAAADLANAALEASLWGPMADPDRDGMPNRLEFLAGGDPRAASLSPLSWHRHPVTGEPILRFTWRAGMGAALGGVQWSRDLDAWSAAGVTQVVVSQRDGVEVREARFDTGGAPPDAPFFVRMQAAP